MRIVSAEEKLVILRALDVDRAIELFGEPYPGIPAMHPHTLQPVDKRTVVLAGMYKARLHKSMKKYFTKEDRAASIEWLTTHGYKLHIGD